MKTKKEEKVKKEDGKTTFKPLKGGRFRCNQTGEILKASKTSSYRRARDMRLLGQNERKALLKRQDQERKATEERKKTRARQHDFWRNSGFGQRSPSYQSFSWGW